jgi:hypothetical protein
MVGFKQHLTAPRMVMFNIRGPLGATIVRLASEPFATYVLTRKT